MLKLLGLAGAVLQTVSCPARAKIFFAFSKQDTGRRPAPAGGIVNFKEKNPGWKTG
jgi:hypothetical protein